LKKTSDEKDIESIDNLLKKGYYLYDDNKKNKLK
jgi:hypothetical protein